MPRNLKLRFPHLGSLLLLLLLSGVMWLRDRRDQLVTVAMLIQHSGYSSSRFRVHSIIYIQWYRQQASGPREVQLSWRTMMLFDTCPKKWLRNTMGEDAFSQNELRLVQKMLKYYGGSLAGLCENTPQTELELSWTRLLCMKKPPTQSRHSTVVSA